jgi:hypothetical protein
MNKAYCGIGKPRSGYHLGSFDECLKKKQLRRFGAVKLTLREKKIINAYEQELKKNRNAKRRLAPKKPKIIDIANVPVAIQNDIKKIVKQSNNRNITKAMATKAKKRAVKERKKLLAAERKAMRDANKL